MRVVWGLLAVLVCVGYVAAGPKGWPKAWPRRVPEEKREQAPPTTCGYDSCPKPVAGMLNVHLVPHTHDDVGWLKTVDQYYYGSKSEIQKAGVQYILDSVIKELVHDPTKRFIYVETAFLWKWWMKQHDTVRHQVKNLVNAGQLEIISGGWSMNDEAVTHYQSTIDQMTWGFRKLNDTFGSCGRPHIGWQIDPFGHSREQASLLAQMGFDGLFIGRLDYQDKQNRLKTKTAEMVWEGSPNNLGSKSSLFTHALFNTYSPPPGFCFDVLCNDEPFIDDKHSPDYNVPKKVKDFVNNVTSQASAYVTNHVVLTMGEDFNYQDANMWYKNMDKLIRHVNAAQSNGSKVNVFYSSPSCYLKAVHDANVTWTTKKDDFFPYASDGHSYWTGYYTSKPTIKFFERMGNNFLQVCKQLYALADLGPADWADLNSMREAMGVLQHHDAVTGTMKDHVAHDYARLLHVAFQECEFAANAAVNKLIVKKVETKEPIGAGDKEKEPMGAEEREDEPMGAVNLESCLLLNISSCPVTETAQNFVITVYNPLGHVISQFVRVPVTGLSYSVKNPAGEEQTVQLVPIHQKVKTVVGRKSPADNELVFKATDLPPLGFRSYYVTRLNKVFRDESFNSAEDSASYSLLGSSRAGVVLSPSGEITSLLMNGVQMPLQQTFAYYLGMGGQPLQRASGAYIFRPNGTDPIETPLASSKLYKGALVDEVHQTYQGGWISQVVRVYKDENHAEFEWMVGPIPSQNNEGKEVISRFTTELQTNATFYTDSNGREMLKRVRNYRPTWQVKLKESVAGNYYPVTSRLLIRDEAHNAEVAVLPDRAQGGSSLKDGQMELMVHRRLFYDDGFGVDEALNEQQYGKGLVARGKHYVIGGPITGVKPSLAAQERGLALRKLLNPWVFLSYADNISLKDWAANYKMEFAGLTAELPANVHILTLEPWKAKTLLLRLEHLMETSDDPILSQPVTVSLKKLFTQFTIVSARETTLGGNQWLSENDRFQWRKETNDVEHSATEDNYVTGDEAGVDAITLTPMQIRTFVIEIADIKGNGADSLMMMAR